MTQYEERLKRQSYRQLLVKLNVTLLVTLGITALILTVYEFYLILQLLHVIGI